MLQHAGDGVAAQAGLREAIAIASQQGARLFALRAACDLARLLADQGRAAEGLALLRPALDALPQGHDQPDARRARALLEALARA